MIIFRFLKFDLTLTQSTLKHSCNLSDSFNTDFQTFKSWNHINETVTFHVQNLNLTWFFCCQSTAASHCNADMLFKLNSADKMSQFLVIAGFLIISTMSDCFTINSAVSYFLTEDSAVSHLLFDDSAALFTMSSDLMSVSQGVFYTDYDNTDDTEYIETSVINIVSTFSSFTVVSSSASTITLNEITVQTAASSAVKNSVILELILFFLFLMLWVIC